MWIATPLVCSKCAGLWVGLVYFRDPILAAVTSLTAYLIDNLIYFIEEKKYGKDDTTNGQT